jgi:endonuclease G
MNEITFQVPLTITVRLGDAANAATTAAPILGVAQPEAELFERVVIDQDYESRSGYDPAFLGPEVALPALTEDQRRNAAKNSRAASGQDSTVLDYEYFSIVMNRRRQLAYYTAVNIDGAQAESIRRTKDSWSFDPRIAESEQIGEELYRRNKLDRGHLVRRLDPAWGSEAARANNDTFHFTNCSPQHERFNQSNETWQGIENFLLNKARNQKQRMTIFTGPVMTDEDPLYKGVRLPVRYWKIAVVANDDGSLRATAFLLDQEGLIEEMLLERFNAQTFQVPIQEIIDRTGLNFSHLQGFEPQLPAGEAEVQMESARPARRRINSLESIVL